MNILVAHRDEVCKSCYDESHPQLDTRRQTTTAVGQDPRSTKPNWQAVA
jgi:hypothetical protein